MKGLDCINLSICIAAYNRPELLRETLESISNLDSYFDVHIVDDMSPRGEEILRIVNDWSASYTGTVDFIRNTKNLGEVETKRILFKRVKRDYLMLLGDDDTLVKSAFQGVIQRLSEGGECFDLELFGYNVINEENRVLRRRKSLFEMRSTNMNGRIRRYFMRHVTFPFYYFHPALYIIKSDVARNLDLDPSIGIGEDYDLFIRIMNSTDVKWRINPFIVFNWRKHNKESKNQSSDIEKRFSTKYLMFKKHFPFDIRRFWFLDVPLWFDQGYLMEKQSLEDYEYSKFQQYLMSNNILKYTSILIWPIYALYKIGEYVLIQTFFIFYDSDNRTGI